MVTILRTVGNQFRMVGPLTTANSIVNPGFEQDTSSWASFDNTGLGQATISSNRDRAKFGQSSCKIVIPSNALVGGTYGMLQALQECPDPGKSYTLSGWLYFPTTLPNGSAPYALIFFSDQSGNTLKVVSQALTIGQATTDWVRFSMPVSDIPQTTYSAALIIGVYLDSTNSSEIDYWVDGLRLTEGDSVDFVNGDYAGFVWANVRYNSLTLQSALPDSLYAFKDNTNVPTPHPVIT